MIRESMIAKVALGYCPCGNPCENPDTGECASCGAARRKAERRKAPDLKRHIPKVSLKRKVELDQYSVLRQTFLLRKWCAVHGKPCLPDQVHHQKGERNPGITGHSILDPGMSAGA